MGLSDAAFGIAVLYKTEFFCPLSCNHTVSVSGTEAFPFRYHSLRLPSSGESCRCSLSIVHKAKLWGRSSWVGKITTRWYVRVNLHGNSACYHSYHDTSYSHTPSRVCAIFCDSGQENRAPVIIWHIRTLYSLLYVYSVK